MKNSEKTNKNGNKGSIIKDFFSKLREKDEIEVRRRVSFVVEFLLAAAIAYLTGGAKLFFGTYPVCIALLCSDRRRLLPISLGLIILAATDALPDVYIFACIAVPLVRILAAFLPAMLEEMQRTPIEQNSLVA